jgi:hypothetical protein
LEENVLGHIAVEGRGGLRRAEPEARVSPCRIATVLGRLHVVVQLGKPGVTGSDEVGVWTIAALQLIDVVTEADRSEGDSRAYVGAQPAVVRQHDRDQTIAKARSQAREGPVLGTCPLVEQSIEADRQGCPPEDREAFDRWAEKPLGSLRPRWRVVPMCNPDQSVKEISTGQITPR